MIKTLDNQKLKRGEVVWGIGVQLKPNKIYKPYRAVVHSSKYNLANPDEGYANFENAKKECDKLNGSLKVSDLNTTDYYQPLFNLMSEHNLTLLECEMDEIISTVIEMENKRNINNRTTACR